MPANNPKKNTGTVGRSENERSAKQMDQDRGPTRIGQERKTDKQDGDGQSTGVRPGGGNGS